MRDDAVGLCQRASTCGPAACAASLTVIEGGALGSPARCGRCKEEPDCLFAHGSFRQTGATGLALAQGGHAGGLGPNPLPAPRQGLLSQEPACQLRHRTVPAPTLRRLASAPLVRNKLSNDIAQLAAKVKNKEGTRLRTSCVFPGRRWRKPSQGKGIHSSMHQEWISFPRLRLAGDDRVARPWVSFPAGAQRRGRESMALRV